MAVNPLRGRDVAALLEAVSAAACAPGHEDAAHEVLRALTRLVPCDVAFWHWLELKPEYRSIAKIEEASHDMYTPELEPWLAHLPEHPVMTGSRGPVTRISDVWTAREFRNTWLYQEVFLVDGLRHEVGVTLPSSPSQRSVVVLSRQHEDFSERDRNALLLVRPHLAAALREWAQPVPRLTHRQMQVLALVRDGLTDAQVARRLGCTEATVGKHLEQIYVRTGAHSRVQAVDRIAAPHWDWLRR
jgi:DNA-binding CsgD family transcriptional regulator